MNKVPVRQFRPPDGEAISIEVIRIEDLPKVATEPVPHRHTFYAVFWVTAGRGTHYLDFVGDEIRPNSLHFIGPGQVHYWELADDLRGVAILFESTFLLEERDQHLLEQLSFFHTINGVSVLYPSAPDVPWFQTTCERLVREYSQSEFANSLATKSWLRLLLIEAQRLAVERDNSECVVSADRRLANRYIQLVEQRAITQHKVEWYADRLAVTVAHLSKSVKSALGMTAGALLRERLVLEAKRLLVHTNETAASIATQLNFEDASYFGRFFKRETDQTPRQFRTYTPTKYQN